MTRMFVNTKIRIAKAIEAREAGQGTLEYLGIVVVVVLLVGALITAFTAFDLGGKITTQLNKIIPG
jgi:pilus assembly protein Flp/PilA